MENKVKSWSRGKHSRLPFGVNVNLNLSISCSSAASFWPFTDLRLPSPYWFFPQLYLANETILFNTV